ncbi:thiamine pyrophosphate-binding protein [Candidatus Erwinia dacicola]|uniref:Acetolactate synthase n=1 Tax=Candidatus Erwinia dacicola TaxID=252393 RepID=A0A1E7YZG0_9GAMM|nr:thiamine pyrophosphate-binding protein [Candidatus Erwinia dacicola]OFC61738.1 acetolactate synthase [Candidatus Erwinia dacicola]RAP70408.1 thiamine pyrophosphate enzyme, central domain protein [Candidatus Erwinia dacicola]
MKAINTLADFAPRSGADILLEVLESEGVGYIFGNPGTTELPLIDALLRHDDIHYILALQESSAVAIADGYAKASGKTGFLNLHTASGLGHGMGNLINSRIMKTPLVVTVGQQDTRHYVREPLLYDDVVSIASPVVKWTKEVTSAAQLPILVRRAFHDASYPPAGPVLLSLPMDVMEEMHEASILSSSRVNYQTVASSLDELAAELSNVQPGKLMMIAGDEIHSNQSTEETVLLAEMLGAHVYGSSWPLNLPFPPNHPLWRGNMPTTSRDIAKIIMNYDAVFILGGKSLITILYSEAESIPQDCVVYQLSSDMNELGRTYPTRLSLMGDIKISLEQLLPKLERITWRKKEMYQKHLNKAKSEREKNQEQLEAFFASEFGHPVISPLVAAHEVLRGIPPGVTIVDEAIATTNYIRKFISDKQYYRYYFMRGGGLGWGMPAAVGHSLGLGREPVVCLVGDGAAMYSPQALWTAAREDLPVTFIVMNNFEYNVLKNFMKNQPSYSSVAMGKFIGMDLINPCIDFQSLAASMGISACRVTQAGDIAAAVSIGIASGKTNLIEVVISAG